MTSPLRLLMWVVAMLTFSEDAWASEDGDDDGIRSCSTYLLTGENLALNSGLDLHFEFDESQDEYIDKGYYRDSSKYGRHARPPHKASVLHRVYTASRTASDGTADSCVFGALSLRGRMHPDHLVVANSRGAAGVDLSSSFSVALWMRLTGSGDHWQTIMDNGVSGLANPAYGLRVLGGTLAMDFWGPKQAVGHNYPYAEGRGSNDPSSSARPEVAVPLGLWTHVAVTMSSEGRAAFYVDGRVVFSEQLIGSRRCSARSGGNRLWSDVCAQIDPIAPEHELWIGREAPLRHNANARAFQGDMDDIRVYSQRTLSSTEVRGLFLLGDFRVNASGIDEVS
jgi:hypothetical protein